MPVRFRCLNCYCVLASATGKAGKETNCPQCRHWLVVPFRSDPFVEEVLAGMRPDGLRSAQPVPEGETAATLTVLLDQPLAPPAGRDGEPERNALARSARVPPQLFWALGALSGAAALLLLWGIIAALQQAVQQTTPQQPTASINITSPKRDPAPSPRAEPTSTAAQVTPVEQLAPAAHAPVTAQEAVVTPAAVEPAEPEIFRPSTARAGAPGKDVAVAKASVEAVPAAQIKNWMDWTHFVKEKVKAPARRSDKDLQASLKDVPEVKLDLVEEARAELVHQSKFLEDKLLPDLGPLVPYPQRDRMKGLPLVMGGACRLADTDGKSLAQASADVRNALSRGVVRQSPQTPLDVASVKSTLAKAPITDATVRACVQIFPEGDVPLREYLVEILSQKEGKLASQALARLAVADPSAKVRAQAGKALTSRPQDEFQNVLVQFLKHPWQPGAERAAELLVELKVQKAVPDLRQLLQEPDVILPRTVLVDGAPQQAVPQLARINHLKGCMICHAPTSSATVNRVARLSPAADFPLGAVPAPNGRVPPTFSPSYYYSQNRGDLFVRADVTFLRQDFSVVQEVPRYAEWPTKQRFDFVARWLPVDDRQADQLCRDYQQHGISLQRQATLYALQQLSGKELAVLLQDWPHPQPSAIKGSGLPVQ